MQLLAPSKVALLIEAKSSLIKYLYSKEPRTPLKCSKCRTDVTEKPKGYWTIGGHVYCSRACYLFPHLARDSIPYLLLSLWETKGLYIDCPTSKRSSLQYITTSLEPHFRTLLEARMRGPLTSTHGNLSDLFASSFIGGGEHSFLRHVENLNDFCRTPHSIAEIRQDMCQD